MPCRKVPLVNDELYHICSKSIAGFKIFNSNKDFERMLNTTIFYQVEKPICKFCLFEEIKKKSKAGMLIQLTDCSEKLVDIIAYCLMPTHIHFILKQLRTNGISLFINKVLMSYSKYFNIKHKRKGPLWESRFGNVLIKEGYLFNHVTRYIHLNPVTAGLVENPKDWPYSSYREYIYPNQNNNKLCNFTDYLDMDIATYVKFVEDHSGYQKELANIKRLTLE